MNCSVQLSWEVASRFCELSESIDFREIHECIIHLLPTPGVMVLDVGAGSGRDAAALAAMGHNVVAVEPMKRFLAFRKRTTLVPRTAVTNGCT